MANRSADATIRGYYYQFDKTILEILNASEHDTIIVEQIEDIDVEKATETKAIQCKYIPSSKFVNSSIRPPITAMLDNHVERSKAGERKIKYHLYAHYSDGIPATVGCPAFTLEQFKKLLTYKENSVEKVHHIEHKINDTILTEFLQQLTLEGGPSFEEQQKQVLERLKKAFACKPLEADVVFYNNALRVIRDLAINPKLSGRRITKAEFLSRINVKKAMFNAWYLQLKGEENYFKLIKKQIKLIGGLEPQFNRMIILDEKYIIQPQQHLTLPRFIERLVSLYFNKGKSFATATPLSIVVKASTQQVFEAKRALLRANIAYNDGHEDLEFQPHFFNAPPVINTEMVGSRPSNKLGRSSYQVRLLRAETYLAHVDDIFVPDKAILFTEDDATLYFPDTQPMHLSAYAQDLDGAFQILSKD